MGNRGNDQFHGGPGADLLRMGPFGFGHDFVFGFSGTWGERDRLDFRGFAQSFADIGIFATAEGSRLVVPAGLVDVLGVPPEMLSAGDFWL